ncbi:hypothetical protein EIN_026770 [Entamoeba invadens IP1]|uniref:hypothetical protein n=1 Tax=Entamoeba invadens IP1 TaxID=370355 RepID=UPI0002C3E1B5|nr:hypothetical protein EIN_026770 [Entamoeba invadens IP1]ELP90798.1 hypothetical protein EIN_026770 [Entamoeba invadens IP1]|eukprot:XP_004257569.1 hypothetical protein EIN_026770 [Entamoeba invadens IP1]
MPPLPLICLYKVIEYYGKNIQFVSKRVAKLYSHLPPGETYTVRFKSDMNEIPPVRQLVVDGLCMGGVAEQIENIPTLRCLRILRGGATNEPLEPFNLGKVTMLKIEEHNERYLSSIITMKKGIVLLDYATDIIQHKNAVQIYIKEESRLYKKWNETVGSLYKENELILSSLEWYITPAVDPKMLIDYYPAKVSIEYSKQFVPVLQTLPLLELTIIDNEQFLFQHTPLQIEDLTITDFQQIGKDLLRLTKTTHLNITPEQNNYRLKSGLHPSVYISAPKLKELELVFPTISDLTMLNSLTTLSLKSCVGTLKCPQNLKSLIIKKCQFDSIQLTTRLEMLKMSEIVSKTLDFDPTDGFPMLREIEALKVDCSSLFSEPTRLTALTKLIICETNTGAFLPPNLKEVDTDEELEFDSFKSFNELKVTLCCGENVYVPSIHTFNGFGSFTGNMFISAENVSLSGTFENIVITRFVNTLVCDQCEINTISFQSTLEKITFTDVYNKFEEPVTLESTNYSQILQIARGKNVNNESLSHSNK